MKSTDNIWNTLNKSSGAQLSGVKDSGAHLLLKKIQGSSVLFHVIKETVTDLGADLEEMSWNFGADSEYRVMLKVCSGPDAPTCWPAGQPAAQVQAEGPCAQHDIPEDWERDFTDPE
jgi:hypothetical protein